METRDRNKYLDYCKARHKVRATTRKIRRSLENKLASEIKNNPKSFWKYYRSKTTLKEGIGKLNTGPLDPNSNVTNDDTEKANIFAEYFSTVFTKENPMNATTLPQITIETPMPNMHISNEMVTQTIRNLKINKSPGPDGIHSRILVELIQQITTPLTIIFRNSLRTHRIPEQWRQAAISAIYKKGNKKLACNYRPISLTSVACKCMEQLIRTHIIHYMKTNKLFSRKQYGFIRGRSTTLQLLKVMEEWTQALDLGNSIDIIYMDFKKAFDKVPHQRLIYKIRALGINEEITLWIKDYLTDRTQKVIINGKSSEWKPVTSGIPQGSVLGPLLFVIYINDLPNSIISDIYMFADDTNIFKIITSDIDCQILQTDLNELKKWTDTWLLELHPDKCKTMTLGKIDHNPRYYLDTTEDNPFEISRTEEEKELGVIFDSKLTFDAHISEKVNKATKMTMVIRRTFQFFNNYNFIPLYKALVRSHLDYANSVWFPYKKSQIIAVGI